MLVNCQEHGWKKKWKQECLHSFSNESVFVGPVHMCRASCLHSQLCALAKMVWVWESFALHYTHLTLLNCARIKTLTPLSNRKMTLKYTQPSFLDIYEDEDEDNVKHFGIFTYE